MKICIVGNSHIASLKTGWNGLKSNFPDVKITFFGVHGDWMRGLTVSGNQLVPTNSFLKEALELTSGGQSYIQPEDYHISLIYGLRFVVPRIESRISQAVKSCALDDAVLGSVNFETAQKFRVAHDGPIYVGHDPVLVADPDNLFGNAEIQRNLIEYSKIISSLQQRFDSTGARIAHQPSTTIDDDLYTKPEYVIRAKCLERPRLKVKKKYQPKLNRSHMNAEFGALYLENWLASLGGEK